MSKGAYVAIEMESRTFFVICGDSEYIKTEEERLINSGAKLGSEYKKVDESISVCCYVLEKTRGIE